MILADSAPGNTIHTIHYSPLSVSTVNKQRRRRRQHPWAPRNDLEARKKYRIQSASLSGSLSETQRVLLLPLVANMNALKGVNKNAPVKTQTHPLMVFGGQKQNNNPYYQISTALPKPLTTYKSFSHWKLPHLYNGQMYSISFNNFIMTDDHQ